MRQRFGLVCLSLLLLVPALAVSSALGQAGTTQPGRQDGQLDTVQLHEKVTRAGVDYLLFKGQAEDGSFSKQISPAVTALCLSGMMEHGVPATHPKVQKGLTYLEALVRPDGGVYPEGSALRNYETSVAVMCFIRANQDGKYDQTIDRAVAFLKGLQWDDGEGHAKGSDFFGGQGYGSHKRPDASNTSYFLDALQSASEDPDSEAVRNAVEFMSRCQNLSTQHNGAEFAKKARPEDRGGFIYSPVGDGETKAEAFPDGGLRSYASMTYAGLKSLLYAGVDGDDVRVKAARDWISRNYDLQSNPGVGQQGLFYYYHVFGKTLDALGEDKLIDSDGKAHDWRADLVQALAKRQAKDGSWTNPADRWYEGDPNLVTAYSLLALGYCKQPSE